MVATLDLIDEALAGGEMVYVHCRAGIGRTRTVHRLPPQAARPRPGVGPETSEQRAFVQSWPAGARLSRSPPT